MEALTHKNAKRVNVPTAEYGPLLGEQDKSPAALTYARRNPDLDLQLPATGKPSPENKHYPPAFFPPPPSIHPNIW